MLRTGHLVNDANFANDDIYKRQNTDLADKLGRSVNVYMCMCICVYVYMCICVCVYVCLCVYVSICIIYRYIHVCMST